MPFSFTFSFTDVPGITNPFAAQSSAKSKINPPNPPVDRPARKENIHHRRPSPAILVPETPLSRKRGWVPSLAEPSQPATFSASTSGYLDTPAKYRDMASRENEHEREVEEMIAELPPAKRRRTLAGSIVSTALSAAVIGTAVGLTVYRLWRDRGKEPEQIPPPPYQEGGWVHAPEPPKSIEVTPPTPKVRRSRHPAVAKRTSVRHRRTRTRTNAYTPPRGSSPAQGFPAIQPEFDFGPHDQEEGDDEMDWIGGKLSQLIAEGKKALGREVVVMSDAQEDEVDDGTGTWEEDAPGPSRLTRSRSGSVRRIKHRPRDIVLPPSYSAHPGSPPPSSLSPSLYATPGTPQRIARGVSVDSDAFSHASTSLREDESAWASPELRESMERARARYLQQTRR